MATFTFFDASGGPLDFILTLDGGSAGLFRLRASVSDQANVSIISPDLQNGATSSAYGRLEILQPKADYLLSVHCLVAGTEGAPLLVQVLDGKRLLPCRNTLGDVLKPEKRGYLFTTMQAATHFGTNFRVLK